MDLPSANRWLLPDGVDELLPEHAWRVEAYRRTFMDCCKAWGFDLVDPPLIEYLDSLLTGSGETMDLQTFKLVDQHNGRAMGVRADMTPQVARIDAHSLQRDIPNRFFYTGSVLRARTDGFGGSRSPRQFGAELFGHAGHESDVELIRLMLTVLAKAAGAQTLLLDIGHVGVYRGIIDTLALNTSDESQLFAAVQRGSVPDVKQLLSSMQTGSTSADQAFDMLATLMRSQGDESMLSEARKQLKQAGAATTAALDSLLLVINAIKSSHPTVRINIDLADLRGYRYHTGVLFAAYTQDGTELARGGRYDAIGAAFGHARPATGFSGDLKRVVDAFEFSTEEMNTGVFVTAEQGDAAFEAIQALRDSGERVVVELPGSGSTPVNTGCDRELHKQQNDWVVKPRQ